MMMSLKVCLEVGTQTSQFTATNLEASMDMIHVDEDVSKKMMELITVPTTDMN